MADHECLLSVGIATYNQKELCRNLVEGLLEHSPQDIRIFIWDNHPNPPIEDFLNELNRDKRIEVIHDDSNSGYIIPNNRMALACRSEYHVVANDDVEVGPEWYETMVRHFKDPNVACVGPKGFFGYLDANFNGQQVQSHQEYDYIEGWWMMFPRHIIDRYGWVFDEENLRVATSEDSHTSLLLREHGWRICPLGNIPIKHLESRTKKSLKIQNWCDENKHWLKKRWANYLKTRKFDQHTILVKDPHVSKEQLRDIRWKYPHSKIVLLLEDGIVDEVVSQKDKEYSMEI